MSDCYFYDVMDRTGYFDEQPMKYGICPVCNNGIYEDEDSCEVNGKHYHTMCLKEMNVIKLLNMFGIEAEED